jgi:glucuronoarabinoxylan endo-1,4-beta-xylanase
LLSFRDFMANGVPLYAMSVQNEPDIQVTYESCDWTPEQLVTWLREQGPRFGDTKLIAAASFNFNRMMTDPILNDPEPEAQVDIIGGHIYGNGLSDYPLTRELVKEVWMTEHYTNSQISADAWPQALDVAKEIADPSRGVTPAALLRPPARVSRRAARRRRTAAGLPAAR